jgi:hypothetical protein
MGDQFGPSLLAVDCSVTETIDEYDERFGTRVETDDRALSDYPGETVEDRIGEAMNWGEIRINDGGTMVWVDPYEWIREYPSEEAAVKWAQGFAPTSTIEITE